MSSVTDVARALDGLDLARMERARWFAGKGRGIAALHLADALPIPDLVDAYLLLVDVSYRDEGPGERYLMPAYVSPAGHVWEPRIGEGFWEALMVAMRAGGELPGVHGLFELRPNALLTQEPAMAGERALGVDQSNTSVILGERVVLKAYRLLATGEHPEVELGRALEHAHYPHVPAFAGSLHHLDGEGRETALAIVQRFVPDSIDPWEGMAAQLGRMIAEHGAGRPRCRHGRRRRDRPHRRRAARRPRPRAGHATRDGRGPPPLAHRRRPPARPGAGHGRG